MTLRRGTVVGGVGGWTGGQTLLSPGYADWNCVTRMELQAGCLYLKKKNLRMHGITNHTHTQQEACPLHCTGTTTANTVALCAAYAYADAFVSLQSSKPPPLGTVCMLTSSSLFKSGPWTENRKFHSKEDCSSV